MSMFWEVLPAFGVVGLAYFCGWIISRFFAQPEIGGRFGTIDGLRGYLAVFVFIPHSIVWYGYSHNQGWKAPSSNLANHLGKGGVAFFFMITAFLFFTKILDGRGGNFDFLRFFVSRFFRLAPLYFLVIACLVLVVFSKTGWVLAESPRELAANISKYLIFTVNGDPDINKFAGTPYIVAGVLWTLPYEWAFYFAVPILALMAGIRPAIGYLAFALLGCGLIVNPSYYLLFFLSGIVAAILVRQGWARKIATAKYMDVVVVLTLVCAVVSKPTVLGILPLLLYSCAFFLIAGGNSVFGLMHHAASRTLGEFSYGIYLFHGLLLYVVFNFLIRPDFVANISYATHWLIILGVTPILIFVCYWLHIAIERPGMRCTNPVTRWIRSSGNL